MAIINSRQAGRLHPAEDTEILRACEANLAGTFCTWGYREVDTPMVDSARILETETTPAVYRFMDPHGQVLALRPDWTTPIAHLAAVCQEPELLPLRLFYRGSVFRREDTQPRELHQTGVEILGAPGDLADGEVVSLAAQILAAAGLDDFLIGIGHVRFIEGLLDHWDIPGIQRIGLQEALSQRDFVSFRQQAAALSLPAERSDFLLGLPDLYGDLSVLMWARQADPGDVASRALDTLAHVYSDLEQAGLSHHIYVDLGLIRDQEYYTGIVFEGYTTGQGHPFLGGGRYDRLASRFGADLPATGFAVHMERLLSVLSASPDPLTQPDALVVPPPGFEAAAMAEADRLRQTGERVLLEITGRSVPAAREFARRQGCRYLQTWQEGHWAREVLTREE